VSEGCKVAWTLWNLIRESDYSRTGSLPDNRALNHSLRWWLKFGSEVRQGAEFDDETLAARGRGIPAERKGRTRHEGRKVSSRTICKCGKPVRSQGQCNDCSYKRTSRWRAANLKKIRQYAREWASRNRAGQKAQHAVRRAIKSGKLIRPDHCIKCGIVCRPQAHHPDYSKQLEVVWLCAFCHAAVHLKDRGKIRRAQTTPPPSEGRE
jgi:hypothetical protein